MPDISFQCPSCSGSLDVPAEMASQLIECPSCKQTVEVPVRTRARPSVFIGGVADTASSGEVVLFQSGEIMVTNTRFVVGTKTFAMRSITSVQSVKKRANYTFPCMVVSGGVVIAFTGFSYSLWLGLFGILTVFQGLWFISQWRPVFTVVLTTAAGEATAYRNPNQDHISQIVRALNDCIISHG